MRIATWNVNGIRARYDEVVRWAARAAPDVFCLQEIKATSTQVPEPLTGLPEYWSMWHGGPGGYAGVSLHVARRWQPARPSFTSPAFDVDHRIVEATVGDVVLASVYVPNGGKDFAQKLGFLRHLTEWVDGHLGAGKRVLLCGDLNVTRSAADVHPSQKNERAIGQTQEERRLFEALLGRGLRDVVRDLAPDDDALFTWWPPWREEKAKNHGWRIDYVLASAGFDAQSFEVLRDEGTSDHAPLVVALG